MLLLGNQKVYLNLKFYHYMVLVLSKTKHFRCKIGMQLNNTSLVVKQNNYTTKIVDVCIVYDFDNWPNNALRNFALKNYLFVATSIIKNSDKEK